jgi:hypothetical protein
MPAVTAPRATIAHPTVKNFAACVALALPCAGCLELVDRLREASSDNGESQRTVEQPPPNTQLRTPPPRPRPIARPSLDGPTPVAEPMPRARAQWIADAPLFRSAPTGAPRPLRAPGWSLYSTAERQAKIILGRRVGRGTEVALYALDGDRLLPERYREPHRVSRDESLFVPRGAQGRSTSVVSVATGRESTPRLTDAQGAPLALEWVALDEDTGQLVVFGRREDGALFSGALPRDTLTSPSPTVTLRHPAPLDPTRYAFGGSPDALDLATTGEQERFEEQPGTACLRARFDRDGAGRCITWGAPQLRASDAFRPIVLGRTLFSDHSPERRAFFLVDPHAVPAGRALSNPQATALARGLARHVPRGTDARVLPPRRRAAPLASLGRARGPPQPHG